MASKRTNCGYGSWSNGDSFGGSDGQGFNYVGGHDWMGIMLISGQKGENNDSILNKYAGPKSKRNEWHPGAISSSAVFSPRFFRACLAFLAFLRLLVATRPQSLGLLQRRHVLLRLPD